ncbi:lipopolysaccharide biosynthesis protein [bacterium]|nr:lipopolysaccharide biosynthesis protein [bacterium]
MDTTPDFFVKKQEEFYKEKNETLSKKVIHGGIWMFFLRITTRVLSLVSTVILARVLLPEDFGIMGIALLSIATLETFSQTGFDRALVQKNKGIKGYLDTAWVCLLMRGVIISIGLFLLAPLVGIFFRAPRVINIIRVIALAQLFKGAANIGVVYFQKELDFKKKFLYQTGSSLVSVVVTLSLVFILRNVWALVYGAVAGSLTQLVLSYLIHPYRPKFKFDFNKAKELFGFGKWIFIATILVFILTKGDAALVGKVIGITALGFYSMAYKFSNFSCTEIAHVISQVSFPAYSKLQNNLSQLKKAYFKVLQMVAFISIPLAGGLFIFTPEFVNIFLGQKWIPMISTMKVLCIFGAIRSILNSFGSLFNGVGKPIIGAKISIFNLAILSVIIFPLTVKFGIIGTAWSVLISHLSSCILGIREAQKLLKFSYFHFFKIIFLPIGSTTILYFIIGIIKQYIFYKYNLNCFFIIITISVLLYCLLFYLLNKVIRCELKELVDLIFNQFRFYKLINRSKEIL